MVHYESEGMFDAPIEKVWKFMPSEHHQHAAFKSVRMVEDGFETELLRGDGKTTSKALFKLKMNPPSGYETTVQGGPLDGASFRHMFTPMGQKTQVNVEGDFRPIAGMTEAVQLKILDDFFTTAFNEDNANMQKT